MARHIKLALPNSNPIMSLSMSRPPVFALSRSRLKMRSRRQKGYLLIELGLVLIVSTILLSSQFSQILKGIEEMDAKSTAEYAKEVQSGVNRYIEENLEAIKTNTASTSFPAPLEPTFAQLQAAPAKYIDPRLGPTSALGLRFNVSLTRDAACTVSANDPACTVTGTAFSTTAYRDAGGQVRMDVLGVAMNAIGKDGAMSFPENAGQLRFQGGTTMVNPVANTAGILAIRVGNHSGITALLNPYYRHDGTKPLTGRMNANQQDIIDVKNLEVTGRTTAGELFVKTDLNLESTASLGTACTAAQERSVRRNAAGVGLALCSGGTWQQVGNVVAGISEGGTCSSAGQIGSNATGVSYICNGSVWSSVNTTAALNGACAPDGRLAMAVDRVQLVCKNGRYVRLMNLLNRSVDVSRVLVTDGLPVNKPTNCESGGTPAYSFQMTQTIVDVAVTPPRQAMYVSATDNGSTWTVNIRLRDHTGAEFSANPYSISAVMKLECHY